MSLMHWTIYCLFIYVVSHTVNVLVVYNAFGPTFAKSYFNQNVIKPYPVDTLHLCSKR